MNKKNLMSQMVNPTNSITMQNLPAELVELSEEDLQQVVGGGPTIKILPDGTIIITYPVSATSVLGEDLGLNLGDNSGLP